MRQVTAAEKVALDRLGERYVREAVARERAKRPSALSVIEGRARTLAATTGKTEAQAFVEILDTEPDLRRQLAEERAGGRR